MSNGKSEAQVSTTPALDQILPHVYGNNGKLQDILTNVRAFMARTLGEALPPSPATESPETETLPSQGTLGNIDASLIVQTVLISELQDTVRVLERIG